MSAEHEQLTELFGEAVALAGDDRAAFIERVRAENASLADELVSLLEADAKSARTADLVPTANLRGAKAKTPAISIPGYRVLDFLGEGGMGTVYSAEQLNPRRRVAIKVLQSASPTALARFHTEAEVMARLDHPNIARVLEAGEADGRPFFVMEHVEGETLDKYVDKVSLDARLALFLQICDAVQHAHLKGVIHRDLKPSNVMVRPDGRAIVLDFGIAHLTDRDETAMTRSGEMIGTPIYMSPEQAQQRSHLVDVRTDVYTLGVILYELASDELPYGERGMPVSVLIVAIADGIPIRLARRVPELRGDLEAITEKALEKEPERRYQSVAALADDVRRYREGLPVSVRALGAVERARRFVRRRPLVAALSALAAIATATFATVVTALWLEARSARRTAEEARERAEARTNQLVLRTARAALSRDPTEAIAWLETLTPRGVDAGAAWAIAGEAFARGVASDVLHAHRDEVHWVEPMGNAFVSGSYDGRAIVWDPQPRVAFTAKRGRVHVVRPSPSGELAVGGDGTATLVARDGSLIDLPGHVGDVQHVAWTADGAWLVTGDEHGHVWAWPHGRPPGRPLLTSGDAIDTIEIAAHTVVAGDRDGELHLIDIDSGAGRTTKASAGIVDAWTDGNRLVAAAADGTVRTWHTDGDRFALDRTVTTSLQIKRAAFPASGAWVALGGVGGAVLRVDGDAITQLWMFHDQVRTLAISPDEKFLAFGSDDGSLELRDLGTGREIPLRGHGSRTRHLAFAPGDTLLSSDSDGVIRRWNLAAMPPYLLDARAPVDRLASDGTHLATVDANGDLTVWTLATAGGVRRGHVAGRTTALALADGTAITGTAEGRLTWWTTPPAEHALRGTIKAIRATHDRVAVATSAGTIELFTLAGAPAGTLEANAGGVEAIAFDDSGQLLASGGQDRAVHVWRRNGDAYDPIAKLDGPQGDTHFIAFAPGRLVSAGNDGRVRAWPIRDGVPEMQVLAQHTGAITALAVTGTWVVSAGHDATLVRNGISTKIPDEAKAVAVAADGTVYAVTRTGAAIRWATGEPVTEIEHGARNLMSLPDSRFVLALDDGVLFERTFAAGSFGELEAELPRTTTFTLGSQ